MAALAAGLLVLLKMGITSMASVVNGYLPQHPALFVGLNGLFVLTLVVMCAVLWLCYREEKRSAEQSV